MNDTPPLFDIATVETVHDGDQVIVKLIWGDFTGTVVHVIDNEVVVDTDKYGRIYVSLYRIEKTVDAVDAVP